MAGARFSVLGLLVIALLAAACSAQDTEALSSLASREASSLARLASSIDANGPLKASIAESDFYREITPNLQVVGQKILDVLNDPDVLEAVQTSSSYNELVANLPEDYQQYAEDIYNAQTTGDVAKDVGGVLTDISIKLVRDTFGRKLLRAS